MAAGAGEKIFVSITVQGMVQGVGFRPYIARLAQARGYSGWVRNRGGRVEIALCAPPGEVGRLIEELRNLPLPGARVDAVDCRSMPPMKMEGFHIVSSESAGWEGANLPVDLPLCSACERELYDPSNRRFGHALITCASCGPRFSILRGMPYDRERTTMGGFGLCPSCEREYNDPGSTRYHAQTIACPQCGPTLKYREGNTFDPYPLERACQHLHEGGVIAIKGLGGYHLACSPYQAHAVQLLRRIKGREQKPFAVMFPSLALVEAVCDVSNRERELLTCTARPIVLLRTHTDPFDHGVCGGSPECGCFLPYTPLHALLLERVGPLVMTSANQSGGAICHRDEQVTEAILPLIAGMLYHDRAIERPVEDSVVRVVSGTQLMLRRGRGYAPGGLALPGSHALFAAGGDLKATFGLCDAQVLHIAPTLGDLEEETVFIQYTRMLEDIRIQLHISPMTAVCDMHPSYRSARVAQGMGIPVIRVQHHHAHIAAVMAEHGLHRRVLGVAFDGTGYGDDGTIWGGEFLLCTGGTYERVGHIKPIRLLGGDGAARDAMRTACCYARDAGIDLTALDARHSLVAKAVEQGINTHQSSSAGRLFDAVSAMLGIATNNGYEGQCAVELERRAARCHRSGGKPLPFALDRRDVGGRLILDPAPGVAALWEQSQRGADVEALALGFHIALAEAIADAGAILMSKYDADSLALSGGVFHNALLLELCQAALMRRNIMPYINRAVSCGDGGLCLGQAYVARKQLEETQCA